MAVADVIQYGGSPDTLVWKHPVENMNATSQLIVDETHEALLVANGNAADLFGPGSHTLDVPNIPLLRRVVSIPTGGVTPFPCKVYFINKVHHMDMLWGTKGPITLEDPKYDIFLHVMLHGNLTFSVEESRRFILKLTGFKDRYEPEDLIASFRGIISSYVKNYISKVMINGKLSYFDINASVAEISAIVKKALDGIFEEYGVAVEQFNIEEITVPDGDYAAITKAKEERASRIIQGYDYATERKFDILEAFAHNSGGLGEMGGMMGGAMMGGVMGGALKELAGSVLGTPGVARPPKDTGAAPSPMGGGAACAPATEEDLAARMQGAAGGQQPAPAGFDVAPAEETPAAPAGAFCPQCGQPAAPGACFCPRCGHPLGRVCPQCGQPAADNARFCSRCGCPL